MTTWVCGISDNGNRNSVATASGAIAATFDAQDRLLTFGTRTHTHTPHGDVAGWTDSATSTTTALTYDVQGNLRQFQQPGTTITYTVDGRNRRIGTAVNGMPVQGFLWQGQLRPVAELDGSGNLVSRFVYGTRINVPEYLERGGTTYRIVTDHLGSVRLVIDTTTDQVVQALTYDPWGVVLQDTNPGFQPFGYAGGLYDFRTGLVRFGVRDYDAVIGRWLAKDPKRFLGADTGLYSYSLSDPRNLTDPIGEAAALIGVGVGAVVGGIGAVAGAVAQDASVGQVVIAGVFGAAAGGLAGANTTSVVFVSALSGLADLVSQLVNTIGCPGARVNVGSVVGSVAAAAVTTKFAAFVPLFEGFASKSVFVQELAKSAVGLPASVLPIVGGALDPLAMDARFGVR